MLAWIFLLNIWSSPKYIPSELETSPMKQSKTYQLVTGFKWCNSWNVRYRHKDTQQFLWYNGERVPIFYPNMTQVHILLNKVPYAVKCNKLGVNPYSYRQSLNFCFHKYKHSNSHPMFHCPLDTHFDWVWTVINLAYYLDKKNFHSSHFQRHSSVSFQHALFGGYW